jgi:carbon-monoxide dehydrogenase large subunit
MATIVSKPETLVGKRIPPARRSAADHRHRDLRRRHKNPGHALRVIVRSPHGAAKIRSIDTSKATAHKGVVAVFTSKDTEKIGPVPCGASLPGLRVPHHTVLATDRVYYVGHPVAVVVAQDRYIAADAADLVDVDWEVLPAVGDP